MSFIYAEKVKYQDNFGKDFETVQIFSDTKTMLINPKIHWSAEQRKNIEKYGFIKSMILTPKCCLSFAGNDVAYAHNLLEKIYKMGSLSESQLVDMANDIHLNAPKNAVEFLICYIDDYDKIHIVSIKDGRKSADDISSAWLGSYDAFNKMQKIRIEANNHNVTLADSERLFNEVVSSGSDDTVGGFVVTVRYMVNEKRFVYPAKCEFHIERPIILAPLETMDIIPKAEEGTYTVLYDDSAKDVVITIPECNHRIIYTQRRLSPEDSKDPKTKYFMLPIVIKIDTH